MVNKDEYIMCGVHDVTTPSSRQTVGRYSMVCLDHTYSHVELGLPTGRFQVWLIAAAAACSIAEGFRSENCGLCGQIISILCMSVQL